MKQDDWKDKRLEQILWQYFAHDRNQSQKIFSAAKRKLHRRKFIFAFAAASIFIVVATLSTLVFFSSTKTINFEGELATFDKKNNRFVATKELYNNDLKNVGSEDANFTWGSGFLRLQPLAEISLAKFHQDNIIYWQNGTGTIKTTKKLQVQTLLSLIEINKGTIKLQLSQKKEIDMKKQLISLTFFLVVQVISGEGYVEGNYIESTTVNTYEEKRKITVTKVSAQQVTTYFSLWRKNNWYHGVPKTFRIGEEIQFLEQIVGLGKEEWNTGYYLAKITSEELTLKSHTYPHWKHTLKLIPKKQKQNIPQNFLQIESPKYHSPLTTEKYKFIVMNPGNTQMENAKITWDFPDNLQYVSANRDIQIEENNKVSTIISLAPKQSIHIEMDIKALKEGKALGKIVLQSNNDRYQKEWEVFLYDLVVMLVEAYDTNDPVEVGQETTYIITLKNQGTNTATNVQVKNIIPQGMQLVEAEPQEISIENNVMTLLPIKRLEANKTYTYKIKCIAKEQGSVKNKVEISYDQFKDIIKLEESTTIYK
ncbi:DUF11 domain-containing protein [Candidatus Uabimicrobium sp. HlEnr_7]|uniref:DUF11 domain-containing protein n=1 Tax=Candidatus Uabimicrobium helgolandensis TaxID=3095367 RepID=UPI003556C658